MLNRVLSMIDFTHSALPVNQEENMGRSGQCSLTFSTLLKRTLRENDGAGMRHTYNVIDREIGSFRVDSQFQRHFDSMVDRLNDRELSTNTIANYQAIVKRILNFGYKMRMIEEIPIRSFDIHREFRDRVWTEDERSSIYKTMNEIGSHLFWSVYFSERNPIRSRSDLWQLKNDDLVLKGLYAPYIRFRPKKTGSRKQRDTYLPEIDDNMLEYFEQKKSRLPDCDFLFPRVWKTKAGFKWAPMGNPRRHWEYVCTKSGVEDLHFHDLKHVAISWMLHARNTDGSARYTRQDLKDLGIQYSDAAIDCYLNLDAESVLSRRNSEKSSNVPEVKYA
jgi:integrase